MLIRAKRIGVICAAAFGVLLASQSASAQPEEPPDEDRPGEEEPLDLTGDEVGEVDEVEPRGGAQRNFAFGPRVGGLWAFGAGVRAGHPNFGVDFSGGWQPVVPSVTPAGAEDSELELFHSWQMSLLAYVAFNPGSTFVAGATGGYSFNSIIGRAGALAFDGVVHFTDHIGFHFHVGIAIYPDAEERLRREGGFADSTELGGAGAAFQTPIGIGLIVWP